MAGLTVLAFAMTGAILLISHVIFGQAASIVVAIASGIVFALLWYVLPLARGRGSERDL